MTVIYTTFCILQNAGIEILFWPRPNKQASKHSIRIKDATEILPELLLNEVIATGRGLEHGLVLIFKSEMNTTPAFYKVYQIIMYITESQAYYKCFSYISKIFPETEIEISSIKYFCVEKHSS